MYNCTILIILFLFLWLKIARELVFRLILNIYFGIWSIRSRWCTSGMPEVKRDWRDHLQMVFYDLNTIVLIQILLINLIVLVCISYYRCRPIATIDFSIYLTIRSIHVNLKLVDFCVCMCFCVAVPLGERNKFNAKEEILFQVIALSLPHPLVPSVHNILQSIN